MKDLDAYRDHLFTRYPQKQFFADGLAAIKYVDKDQAALEWEELKRRVFHNEPVFIRGFGRDAKGTRAFQVLYKHLFGNEHVKKDPDNNYHPARLLGKLTKYVKREVPPDSDFGTIRNYQISHLFGRTKNPLLFTAPWNFAYVPKFLDPFTGHETKGDHVEQFQPLFDAQNRSRFGHFIADYNQLITERVEPSLSKALLATREELRASFHADYELFEKRAREELALL
ncbi:MAG TPA: hypothetical protein PLA11_13320 [Flavobacteriales bacterium]|nr:hypothetical protein [Flavobacteriales bacterium]HOP44493.1 hypothetical protein [Flavobacteriales bacterium]